MSLLVRNTVQLLTPCFPAYFAVLVPRAVYYPNPELFAIRSQGLHNFF